MGTSGLLAVDKVLFLTGDPARNPGLCPARKGTLTSFTGDAHAGSPPTGSEFFIEKELVRLPGGSLPGHAHPPAPQRPTACPTVSKPHGECREETSHWLCLPDFQANQEDRARGPAAGVV